jgi:GntR family transcriptional regulator
MDFTNNQAIYLQIAEIICEKVLRDQFREDERIPSVRELAVQLEVNPNTVMRTFDFLQANGIITNKRGIGYFVAPGGKEKAYTLRRDEFLKNELPKLVKTAALLQIDLDELTKHYLSEQKNLSNS